MLNHNHAIIRKLKDIPSLHLKNSYKTIILLCSALEIPTEIEKEITVLSFPLPTREDLGILLDKIALEVREFKNVKIDLGVRGASGCSRPRLV